MKILGLDLGMKTGYAILDTDTDKLTFGLKNLNSKVDINNPYRSSDILIKLGNRINNFNAVIYRLLQDYEIDYVIYEYAVRHMGVNAAHNHGAYLGALNALLLSSFPDIIALPAPVKAIKKYATGSGNAKKEDMIYAVNQRFPTAQITDDNIADAVATAMWGHNFLTKQVAR